MNRRPSERAIVFLVGAVQFINILDFMIVMPLGPDFAKRLAIPESNLGLVAGAYTWAAGIAGFIGAFVLDRFDRRKALAVAMAGLVIGTAAGGFATGLTSLMAARFFAGAFGGPATSIALSIIADVIPPERRGKAMGAVMGAFSVASVLGVPAGLELARLGGWRTPFFAIAAMGLVIAACAVFFLPSMTGHIDEKRRPTPFVSLFARPLVILSYGMTALVMAAGFILIPHISTYLQFNLGYPRASIGLLYMVGGAVSFATMRVVGILVDRYGSFRVGTVGSFVILNALYFGFVDYLPQIPVMGLFVGFMVGMSIRNVAYHTLATKVPRAEERARFMSFQSTVQHVASGFAAFFSAKLLTTRPDHGLGGVPVVASVSMALTALVPVMLWLVETRVRAEARQGQGNGPVTTVSRPPPTEAA